MSLQQTGTHIRIALVFLTQLPLAYPEAETRPLGAHVIGFPFAGAVIGLLTGMVLAVAGFIGLPEMISAVIALVAATLITRGLHEDGLADMVDGFAGAHSRDKRLEIMRDSHIGTFGVMALILSLGLRGACIYALLSQLGLGAAVTALIAADTLSRSLMAWAMYDLPAARMDGRAHEAGKPLSGDIRKTMLIGGIISVVAIVMAREVFTIIVVIIFAGFAYAVLKRLALAKIGGQTGDVLGACQQLTHIAVLAGCCVNL